MITIKNSKGEVCDVRIPYDIHINEEVENFQKLINECMQKMIKITGIPKNRLNKEHENN